MTKLAFAAAAAALAMPPAAATAQPGPPPGAHPAAGAGHSWRVQGPNMHPGRDFHHRRLHVGAQIHPFWFGPQFHVQDWQAFGLHRPRPDHRWVRYYDDAYLVDDGGYVRDTRYGLDWDAYAESGPHDRDVPRYVGEGDYHPDERDYAWVEEYGPGPDYGPQHGAYADRGYGPAGHDYPPPADCRAAHPRPCGAPVQTPAQSYGYGYPAYGCGYCGQAVTIVETTVTPVTTTYVIEEVVEEIVETRRPGRRVRSKRVRRAPPPPPPAGERG